MSQRPIDYSKVIMLIDNLESVILCEVECLESLPALSASLQRQKELQTEGELSSQTDSLRYTN